MGRKKSRTKQTSKGERVSVRRDVLKEIKAERAPIQSAINKLEAHSLGKKTWVTIENPNKKETNKRFIKVPGHSYFKGVKRA
ncbi:hypothetical protein [uncultured virus]|uniref:Uncharacterized protein n=1 Tax=uncultured virus TaxID=340016 RepID=A0A218MKE5_9VIRU|nr:hypothetical protein [uncultured virus]|tara:strand:- start:192 stop:437 length:246 start_codon:yes stop_codon:yes gene_type:complete